MAIGLISQPCCSSACVHAACRVRPSSTSEERIACTKVNQSTMNSKLTVASPSTYAACVVYKLTAQGDSSDFERRRVINMHRFKEPALTIRITIQRPESRRIL